MVDTQNNGYLVGIRCYTYNHAPYIEYALNGFTMQQTNFPFIAMVVDDASTDGEQKVISSYVEKYFDIDDQNVAYQEDTDYAHITFARHKTNRNCFIVVLYLKENHYQKRKGSKKLEYLSQWRDKIRYEALCEGDDYWVDPLKLRQQVDFLETNMDYGLVHTDYQFVDINNNIIPTPDTPLYKNMKRRIKNGYVWGHLLINKGFILTCTVLYKQEFFDNKEKYFIDHGLFLMISRKTKIHYINSKTSSYRRNPQGMMLSSHKTVSDRMRLILLNQLSCYHSAEYATANFYKASWGTLYRRFECFASIIMRGLSNLSRLECSKLVTIILKNPFYIILFPITSIIILIKKTICKK